MRIAWLSYGALDQVSGAYIYDSLVVDQLRELGDSVTVFSLGPGSEDLPHLDPEHFDTIVGDALCFRQLLHLFEQTPSAIRRAILVHHLSAWEQEPGVERAELLALELAAISAADVCLATSRVTADRLQAEGIRRAVVVAEPGADRMPRPSAGGQEPCGARLRLLFVGNIVRRKRVLELCQAFAGLPSANAELVLVGAELEPDYAAQVREFVKQADVVGRVRFVGALPAAGVAEQLTFADALVLPSALEGYGMVLSEALWAAVPVITARVGAAEQLVSQTNAGLLFELSDSGGLGATLGAFVADAELRARLRHAAWLAEEFLPRWRDTAAVLRGALRH